eukprot:CAMPEP_0202902450 /NCGR_PEP_ID=MMETSP1392-20130828/16859_1 /ASSEMBLY_ACC=CAM_ASM_000868 /TAXON_ID=225041 /ORGANISM="Chlamydomonas chlamydogama, Strain SAG 11-48b" /LENGTH=226 /DNA_ID=CAMNT_0049589211 /DNA_START=155 /DNA_END=832 /DNA_ORIENTATION=-
MSQGRKRKFNAEAGAVDTESSSSSMLDVQDWKQLAAGYKAYDEKREMVIKRCRDMQKLSKNAIYALHRGDRAKAKQMVSEAEAIARELLPTISASPSLRQGSFTNACEEYAEALILQVYLEDGRVMAWREAEWLTCEEYLGGLLDFTGELQRLAVARATERDEGAVRRYLGVLEELVARLVAMDLRQPWLRKKLGPLDSTHSKMQGLLYELSLTAHNKLMAARVAA